MSNPTNKPSRELIRESTNQMDLNAKLLNNLSPANSFSGGSEGGVLTPSQQSLHNVQNNRVSFFDVPVRNEQEIVSTSALNTNSHNLWQMPSAINLDSSGLHRSSQTEVLKCQDKVYTHTTQGDQGSPLHSASKRCFKSALVLFYLFRWVQIAKYSSLSSSKSSRNINNSTLGVLQSNRQLPSGEFAI
jgi:hypothetical protein